MEKASSSMGAIKNEYKSEIDKATKEMKAYIKKLEDRLTKLEKR